MSLVTLCLQILPLLLGLGGLGGSLGLVSLGPGELPRRSALNRWLGVAVLLLAAGLALYDLGRPVSAEVGLGGAILAVVLYTALFQRARRQYSLQPPTRTAIEKKRP